MNLHSSLLKSPALRYFGILWFICAVYLGAQGHWTPLLLAMAAAAFWGLHTWASLKLTEPPPPDTTSPQQNKRLLMLQAGLVILLAALANQPAPGWEAMVMGLRTLGERLLPVVWVGGPGNAVANPVQYFVIPLLLLMLLGAKPRELGLQRGWQSWRASAVWLAIPLTTWLVMLVLGTLAPQRLVRLILGNALQNGFFEEFLFRGALQSRLDRIWPTNWALVVQALLFGLWHLNANLNQFADNLLLALAWSVVSQSVLGLLLGLLFVRTRSLIAPSVAHIVANAFGQTFG